MESKSCVAVPQSPHPLQGKAVNSDFVDTARGRSIAGSPMYKSANWVPRYVRLRLVSSSSSSSSSWRRRIMLLSSYGDSVSEFSLRFLFRLVM